MKNVSAKDRSRHGLGRLSCQRIVGYLFAVLFILLGWWLLALLVDSPALPTPLVALSVFSQNTHILFPYFVSSLVRVVAGLGIGTLLAVPIAQFCARSKTLDELLAPTLYALYPIPKVVFLPILLVLLGLNNAPKILLIALTIFFQVLVTVRDAVKDIPESALISLRSLGASRIDEYRHAILPATIPALFTSLRIGVGTAIAVLFIAEAMAGSSGLGYFIMQSWSMVNYPRMFAGIIALSLLGLALFIIFDLIERHLTKWK